MPISTKTTKKPLGRMMKLNSVETIPKRKRMLCGENEVT
jgi:hypothetical protein